jgi:AraC-like DNA-binding protein
MDFSTKNLLPEFREEKFRTPFTLERKLGLWVDRIGQKISEQTLKGMRRLGQYALVAVESDKGILRTKSSGEIILYPGDVFIHFPEEPTLYYPDTSWKETWIVFNGSEVFSLQENGLLQPPVMVIKNAAHIVSHAYQQLSQIINAEDVGAILKRKAIAFDAITSVYNLSGKTPAPILDIMTDAIKYIKEQATAKTSVKQLAEQCCLSETHFRRTFKQYTGRTPKEYICATLISKAKQYLASGNSIKKTAQLTGFDDVCYFMRVFKKLTSLTAAKFRELYF